MFFYSGTFWTHHTPNLMVPQFLSSPNMSNLRVTFDFHGIQSLTKSYKPFLLNVMFGDWCQPTNLLGHYEITTVIESKHLDTSIAILK